MKITIIFQSKLFLLNPTFVLFRSTINIKSHYLIQKQMFRFLLTSFIDIFLNNDLLTYIALNRPRIPRKNYVNLKHTCLRQIQQQQILHILSHICPSLLLYHQLKILPLLNFYIENMLLNFSSSHICGTLLFMSLYIYIYSWF